MPFILAAGISQCDDIPIHLLEEPFRFSPVEKQEKNK